MVDVVLGVFVQPETERFGEEFAAQLTHGLFAFMTLSNVAA